MAFYLNLLLESIDLDMAVEAASLRDTITGKDQPYIDLVDCLLSPSYSLAPPPSSFQGTINRIYFKYFRPDIVSIDRTKNDLAKFREDFST